MTRLANFRALLSSELQEIFSKAPANPTGLASQRVREAYAAATGSPSKASSSQAPHPESRHKNPNGDDCAVCYEAMEGDAALLETILVWCETCSNAVHKECFGQCERFFLIGSPVAKLRILMTEPIDDITDRE